MMIVLNKGSLVFSLSLPVLFARSLTPGAQRTLEGVGCSWLLGLGWVSPVCPLPAPLLPSSPSLGSPYPPGRGASEGW